MSVNEPAKTPKKTRSTTKAAVVKPKAGRLASVAEPAAAPKSAISTPQMSDSDAQELSKKELIERIAEDCGAKKGEVRTVLDATLRVLGAAIDEGMNVSAAPMGKIKVVREKETPNGKLVVCRIKLKGR